MGVRVIVLAVVRNSRLEKQFLTKRNIIVILLSHGIHNRLLQ